MKKTRENHDQYPIDKDARAFSNEQLATIEKFVHTDLKVMHLENLGFTSVEDNGDNILFDGEYSGSSIDTDEVELTDTAKDIERKADYYSCCGDILDKDIMICPTCHEHC